MTPERWQQVGEIFQAAVELDPDERAAFLVNRCANDEELQREVESLITADKEGLSIVDEPAVKVAAGLLVSSENELMEGQSIGRYEIVRPIGKGGMGEVYLAKDKLLNRRIALKLLPADYSSVNDRLQRFEREAQAASALNHPNILTIHEIGRVDNQEFIATEFVEGETLRQRMKQQGGLSLSEALDVTTQIANALAVAHKAGIIHRDIKPENIMLRPDGYVKVLDFGLAKLTQEAERLPGPIDTAKPEISSDLVMGTVKYMSPEQARGLSTDLRSDIFSLGVVLYEMTTGHAPFKGTASDELVQSILKDEPRPLTEYAPNSPAELQRIVSKTLNKNRAKRYQTAEDLLVDLKTLREKLELKNGSRPLVRGEEAGDVSTRDIGVGTASTSEYLVSQIKQHKAGAIAGVLTLLALILGFTYPLKKFLGKQSASKDKLRVTRLSTTGSGVGGSDYFSSPVAISPDGTSIAYVADSQGSRSLLIRPISTDGGVELVRPKTQGNFVAASFSPDGSQVFYLWSETLAPGGDLYRISVAGGSPEKVTKDIAFSFAFSPDGKRIAYWRGGSPPENTLFVANIDGSDERKLSSWDTSVYFGYLAWSPDGRTIACSAVSHAGAVRVNLVSIRVEDGKEQPISPKTWEHNTGQIAWLSDGSGLLMIGKDEHSASKQIWLVDYPSGDARKITNDLNDYLYLSLTANSKTLVTVNVDRVSRIWVARNGDTRQARQITSGKYEGVDGLTWTADGRIVFVSPASGNGNDDIWIMNDDGSHRKQLTSDPHNDSFPAVSPDNRYIVFSSNRAGTSNIWRMNIDGSNPSQLTHGSLELYPEVSPDGQWVVYASFSSTTNRMVLWRVPLAGGNPIQLAEGFAANGPTISPDGKLVACITPFKTAIIPFEGGKPVKTLDRRSFPFRWTPDSRSLTFLVTQNGVSNLLTQALDTNETRAETDFKSDLIFDFDWSRDRSLVYSQGVKTSDIVLISDFR